MNNSFEIVKAKIKLTDLVDQDLNPKRSGKVLKDCCPFHDEKTPSFTIYPKDQTFHCFGCGKGGTVIDYIMFREEIKEPYAAVEYLAEQYNLNLPGFDKEAIKRKKETVKSNRSKALAYLRNVKQGESFLLDRGFTPETIKRFGIGFSIPQNAITIPYLDTYGNVVGTSYRNLDETKPKYVNEHETEVFKKSELLYGLDKARKHIKDKVFIVEGYFDVMAMYQMGYKETVAYCGQSLTDGQATLLSKYIKRNTKIFLIPDNDKTGLKQVANNIKILRSKVRNPIGVYSLPEGIKDANDILRLGRTIDDLGTSEHHEMFLLKQELDQCLEQTDEYEVAQRFVQYTKNKIIRSEMASYLSERWNKPKDIVLSFMETDVETIDYDKDLKTFTSSLEGYKESLREGATGKVFFNLTRLDAIIPGMKKGEVCFLMGRSGAGKTTMALNMIYNAIKKQNQNVVFNSLELNSENIVPQLLQIHHDETQNKVARMVEGNNLDEQFLSHMDRRLRIVDRPGQTMKDIEQFAIMANEQFDKPLAMIVIDYFQYIKTEGKKDNYAEMSGMARGMKELAKKLNCVVVVLTQTSREGGTDGSTPLSLQSARDTGAIEETGDYVLGVYRPAASSKLTDAEREEVQHEYYCQVLKNRWGKQSKVLLRFEPLSKVITDWRD